MMNSCEDHDFPCQNQDYEAFDGIARAEICNPIDCDTLVNNSEYCMMLPTDSAFDIGDLTHKLYLKPLKGSSGLYHLWENHESCSDHDTYTMLCAYVGKGPPNSRIASHIKEKWRSGVDLYATFTAIDNRLAKYYEQLFLDTYNFELNSAENSGVDKLYAVWDSERYELGTHANEASSLSKMQGFDDW